jgi:hypothetical protein
MFHHLHSGAAMSHHLHFGSGLHYPRKVSMALRGSAVLWISFAVVVIAIVIASGVNALPGH